jgi:hypothetical protein
LSRAAHAVERNSGIEWLLVTMGVGRPVQSGMARRSEPKLISFSKSARRHMGGRSPMLRWE